MERNTLNTVSEVIKSRRSTGWAKMNGQIIPNELVQEIVELATWAPNHGKTEPWKFFVYTGEAMKEFGRQHAALYKANTPEEKYQEATAHKLEHNVDKASHVIVAAMTRGINDKIPVLEEIAAASAAIQNLLLAATAAGIANFWSTGGQTLQPAMKTFLGLGEHDTVLGMLFLGYTDEPAREGVRSKPAAETIIWK